jgi:hypothetical protein
MSNETLPKRSRTATVALPKAQVTATRLIAKDFVNTIEIVGGWAEPRHRVPRAGAHTASRN